MMTRGTILVGKMVTLFLWGLVALAVAGRIAPPLQTAVMGFGALVLLVHLFEIAYLLVRHRHRMTAPWRNVLSVLVFGVFSLTPLITGPAEPTS